MVHIEEKDLQKLVTQNANKLKSNTFPFETLIALLLFSITVYTYNFFNNKVLFFIGIIIAILYLIYFIIQIKRFINSKYTSVNLYQDIINITKSDKIHNFSLIVFKNTENYKYLMRYDKRWKCYLLPYKKTMENDLEEIKLYIEKIYKLNNVSIKKVLTDDIEKYSYSSNSIKKYHHTFYFIEFDTNPFNTLKINNDKYKWFSVDELKQNKKIMQRNQETIDFIEKYF